MGYINPLLELPAGRALQALPVEQRAALEMLLRQLRAQADAEAEKAWRRRKGPMASYWRGVATYARHTAHALRRAGEGLPGGGTKPAAASPLAKTASALQPPAGFACWLEYAIATMDVRGAQLALGGLCEDGWAEPPTYEQMRAAAAAELSARGGTDAAEVFSRTRKGEGANDG